MKIVFVISTLHGGGAERVAVTLANELTRRGHSLRFIVHSDTGSAYDLDQRIKILSLFSIKEAKDSIFHKLWRKATYYFRLNKLISKSETDVIVSFIKGTNGKVLPFSYLKKIPHIVTEHDTCKIGINKIGTQIERKYLYKLASVVTVLTERDLKEFYSKYLDNAIVLPNPLPFKIHPDYRTGNKKEFILTVGDLRRWQCKGFDKLIKVFSKLHEEFPSWRLKVAGKGSQGKKELRDISIRYNVDHKVDFLGFVSDMPSLYREASIFALYSKIESFGMVLTEAMSQGCPVISYDSGFGPSEIINDGEDGILVKKDDINVYVSELKRMIKNPDLRNGLAKNALKKAENYSIKNITDRWETILNRVVEDSSFGKSTSSFTSFSSTE